MPILFLLLSYFLAYQSNFDFIFLTVLLLVGLSSYFKIVENFNIEIKKNIQISGLRQSVLLQRILLVMLYILSLFLAEKIKLLPEIFRISKTEFAGFFFLLYIPIILLFKFSADITVYIALLLLLVTPFSIIHKYQNTAEILPIVV